MEPKNSPLGIISFIISVVAGFFILATFIAAGVLHNSQTDHRQAYPGQTIVGLAIMGLCAAELIAAVLGLVSLFQQGRKRLFGVLGLAISSVILLATIGLMIVGLMLVSKAAR